MKRIMVVEDEKDVQLLMAEVLKDERYEIVAADDGDQALRDARELRPQLVLLDVMLPGIDGFEVCRRLKADPATRDIRVIMVSARSDDRDIRQGLACGADHYVTKPIKLLDLSAAIQRLLG
ncbi:MAG: response regulator [Candidatus Edwardsbacteria bacterium]|nr:response regulator [Candidatus Edwardsbacteria bacterium]